MNFCGKHGAPLNLTKSNGIVRVHDELHHILNEDLLDVTEAGMRDLPNIAKYCVSSRLCSLCHLDGKQVTTFFLHDDRLATDVSAISLLVFV